MSALHTYKILTLLTALAMLASGCGSAQLNESAVSTSVAQTGQARNTSETAEIVTSPAPTLTATALAPLAATVTGTPLTGMTAQACTASASLVGETFPDGTIILPGTTFTKVWQVQNSGTCTWDATWQLIFYGGDLMDGLTVYNFPQPAGPGQTVDEIGRAHV